MELFNLFYQLSATFVSLYIVTLTHQVPNQQKIIQR